MLGELAPVAREDEPAVAADLKPGGKPRSTFRRGVEVFLENKLAVTGVCIFAFMILFCFIGPLIYHTNQLTVDFAHEELPPSGAHLLGTDASGFDVLGRLMVAGQVSLEVGIAAAVLATVVGVLWGAIAAGGRQAREALRARGQS
jgi:peptide/nickel transport system permease protein